MSHFVLFAYPIKLDISTKNRVQNSTIEVVLWYPVIFNVLQSYRMNDMDKDKDPSESLMDLMKKMYDEGDDEMKRTIAKAWTESREKQAAGSMI